MKKNGFTLIETIGIIIVIALIATITIPIIINTNDRNRVEEQEKADIIAVLDYYFDAHTDLKNDLKTNGQITVEGTNLVNEGYIHEVNYYKIIIVKYSNGTYELEKG